MKLIGIKNILAGFKKRSGFSILLATIIARILSFSASLIALRLIDNNELGLVIFAFTIISFIIPIGGLGLHQSLIRYGALLKNKKDKDQLFSYVLKKGIFWSFILIIFIFVLSNLFSSFLLGSKIYVILLSFSVLTYFLLEIIKIQFRLRYQNNLFAAVEVTFNVLLVLLVFLLSLFFKEIGYAIALLISPLITFFIFFKQLRIDVNQKNELNIIDRTFWKYGFYASLSNVATQLLSSVDIILIGVLLNQTVMVTTYKYIVLIPLSLLFLSQVFITTDFVKLTENIFKRDYIKNYIENYIILFVIISTIIGLFSWLFSEQILSIFGDEFKAHSDSFMVLILGVTGILILRGLFGNLLSAIGHAKTNYYIALFAIFINLFLNYQLIPKYGIFGAALTSSIIMWLTGIVSAILFFRSYSKIVD
jgi:O-antigen/teichoic acid export membrane protein